ncbi:MAG: hypothetical protein EAX90_03210 [Candidatus Heimdallarchaeota archaeon]|nr:hypothetical protein [Candidatus Heimdallarchaeota archaeon]
MVGIPSINLTIFGISPENMINYIFYFELAFAIAYILTGFFFTKTPMFLHIIFVILIAGGITTGLYFLDNFIVVTILGFVLYCLWMFITIVSTFSFGKNLLGSKVTGSILFMGKKEGGAALFSGILTPLILCCIGMNGYILYQGIVTPSWLYITTAIVGILVGGFLIFAMWYLARKDDVFYTILPFFYLMTNTHVIQLVIRLIRGDTTYISWLSILVSVFFLLNSISKYYRKVKKLDADFLPNQEDLEEMEIPAETKKRWKKEKPIEKEEFFISDIFRFITDRGVIMLILGFALANHSVILQIGFNRANISAIFVGFPGGVVQTAHSLTMLFAALAVVIIIILNYASKRFKSYLKPKIFRLNFLPPYEDVENFVINAKSGNINWKLFARDATISLAKKGVSATTQITVSAKDQTIDLAKKGIEIVKTKASSVVEKTKKWGQRFLSEEEEEIEYLEEVDDNDF